MNTIADYIHSQFTRPDFDVNPVSGSIKVRGANEGETNWLNVSQEQLIVIRAIMMLDASAQAQVIQHIKELWPDSIGEFK